MPQSGRASASLEGSEDPDLVVEANDLRKGYDGVEAVAGVSFSVRRGECFGLLGPNGAGKTTTIRMIQCAMEPTSGGLSVLGMDVRREGRRIKARLGVVPQENNLDPDFSVEKNLRVYARYFDIPWGRAEQTASRLLSFMALSERAGSHIDSLSGGLKRRLVLARALVNDPDLLVLDEPTTGLDPQARHAIWDKVRELKREGKTLLLTTHYMDEAETLCDRLVIIDKGRILVEGAPRDLIREHAGREVLEVQPREPGDVTALEAAMAGAGLRVERAGGGLLATGDEVEPAEDRVAATGRAASITIRRATLEDVFLRLTGRGLRE